jgi:hypothetical protein
MKSGHWLFDFNGVLLKKYDGSIHPSDMASDPLGIWVRVLDLVMDTMNQVYTKLIGVWIGIYKYMCS